MRILAIVGFFLALLGGAGTASANPPGILNEKSYQTWPLGVARCTADGAITVNVYTPGPDSRDFVFWYKIDAKTVAYEAMINGQEYYMVPQFPAGETPRFVESRASNINDLITAFQLAMHSTEFEAGTMLVTCYQKGLDVSMALRARLRQSLPI